MPVISRPPAVRGETPARRTVWSQRQHRAKEMVMAKYLVVRASLAVGSLAALVATVGAGRKWF
jgi:hypothetical protein